MKFREQGSNLSKDRIQSKFRQMKAGYTKVKDNNGKTGSLYHGDCTVY